nr:transcription factor bHLH49 isoform X1 [Ipomoea batatas]
MLLDLEIVQKKAEEPLEMNLTSPNVVAVVALMYQRVQGESLLPQRKGKEILQSRAGPSSSLLSFPHDMTMPYPPVHHPPSTLIQAGLPSLGSSADAIRRTINSHLATASGSFKEPTPQVPSMWDDELHNVVQMGFNPSAPLDSQDIGSLPPGHMKSEP